MMEIPSDMKGLVKSITFSLSDVIVSGANAMSASCIQAVYTNNLAPNPGTIRRDYTYGSLYSMLKQYNKLIMSVMFF